MSKPTLKNYAAARKEQEAMLLETLNAVDVKVRAAVEAAEAVLADIPESEPCIRSLLNMVNISKAGFLREFPAFKSRVEAPVELKAK